jgi:hypothetical protein
MQIGVEAAPEVWICGQLSVCFTSNIVTHLFAPALPTVTIS